MQECKSSEVWYIYGSLSLSLHIASSVMAKGMHKHLSNQTRPSVPQRSNTSISAKGTFCTISETLLHYIKIKQPLYISQILLHISGQERPVCVW